MVVLVIFQSSSIMGWSWVKKKVATSNFRKKYYLHSSGHMFGPIFLKHTNNALLDDISIKLNHGLGLHQKVGHLVRVLPRTQKGG